MPLLTCAIQFIRMPPSEYTNDRVDILIDLVGYMRGNRLEICAYRPAPVQVRWLGLAGTTGADFFDYIITDKIVTPEDQSKFFSEKFVFMPHSYQVNSKPIEKTQNRYNRQDVGLPEKAFVFCCFCSNYKIDSNVFNCWMKILKQSPGSVLWVMTSNSAVTENMKDGAKKARVDPYRLIFAKKLSKPDHLERLKLADLSLDTITVNGAATTSDALWAGVPVVTIVGNHFASRMSASILSAVGLSELIVNDNKQYVDIAVDLANNPNKFHSLREKLKKNKQTYPLFDTQLFVESLENAYAQIWELHKTQRAPRAIEVKDFKEPQPF